MNLTRSLLHPVALGLVTALTVTLLLGGLFFSQAGKGIRNDRYEREAIMHAMALAEAVPVLEKRDADSAPEKLQQLVADWKHSYPDVNLIRIIRLNGSYLLASTVTADSTSKAVPRRLQRDEKWLYDLGQELRAAVETNKDEGVFRKKQVDIETRGDQALRITLPYYRDGGVDGIVQLEQRFRPRPLPGVMALSAVCLIAPLAVYLLLTGIFRGGTDVSDENPAQGARPAKPWGRFLLALLLFSAASYSYAHYQLAGIAGLQHSSVDELAGVYGSIGNELDMMIGAGAAGDEGTRPISWDVDEYQRPHSVIMTDATVDYARLFDMVDSTKQVLVKSLWGNWTTGLILLGFVALGYGRRLRETIVEHRSAYLYVTPAIFGMLLLVFFPFSFGIALSFTNQTLFNINLPLWDIWVWFDNYLQILGDFNIGQHTADGWVFNYQNFYWTLFITVCWTVFNVAIGVSIGMVLALALNTEGLRFKAVYRILLILPWAIPNYITALIWKGMFHPQFGVINQAILMFGGEPVAWFDGVFSSFLTGLVTNGWLSFPFMMVVILGALQSITSDMYEAAKVEGATRWQQFVHITLPSLKPTLIPAVIISVVWTFNMFNIIYLVSEGQPAGANEILITDAYKIAFEKYQYGYAAAYSVVVFIILLVYGVFQTRVTRATEANA